MAHYSPSFSNLPVFGVLPAGSIRICQDQGVQFTWMKAIPCNAGGPVFNLGGCQHFAQFVDLRPAVFDLQRVLRPLIHFLQAQRPGPLAKVHRHRGAERVRQQRKRLVDSQQSAHYRGTSSHTAEEGMRLSHRPASSLLLQSANHFHLERFSCFSIFSFSSITTEVLLGPRA